MIYICAADHRQYIGACQKLHLNPHREAVYLSSEEQLYGVRDIAVYFNDGWWLHPKHREIYELLHTVGYEQWEPE